MKKHISILPILLCFFITLSAYTQEPNLKHTYKWYFGYGAGLDFSSGEPVPLTDGQTSSMEATFVANDDQGNLLFYGQHDTIWNKNHEVMLNGANYGTNASITQIQCVKQPGNDSLYYLFHPVDVFPASIYYSIININADNGLGALMSTEELVPSPTAQGIGAVLHCNGTDIWVIAKELETKDLMAWQLTEQGMNSVPVISSNVLQIPYNENPSVHIIFSPDNSMAAATYLNSGQPQNWENSAFELYQFDNCSGVFSNPVTIDFVCPAGIAFSPDNTKLYVGSTVDCVSINSEEGVLAQYDISSYNQADILSSETVLSSGVEYAANDMRIGPDGKIYVCDWDSLQNDWGTTYLGVIQNPNSSGTDCDYVADLINIDGFFPPDENLYNSRIHFGGLPEFLQHYFNGLTSNVGVNKVEELNISVYPNPFENQFTIENTDYLNVQYTLSNVTGKVVLNGETQSKQTDINTLKLRKGVYLIHIQNGNNKTQTIKAIKL